MVGPSQRNRDRRCPQPQQSLPRQKAETESADEQMSTEEIDMIQSLQVMKLRMAGRYSNRNNKISTLKLT